MPDYSQGKIYSIRSHQTDKIYIGSTTQTLAQRLGKHRRNYKCFKQGKYNYVTSYEILQYKDAYIELLKEYPCKCKAKLDRKEGKYIRKYIKKGLCVNKRIEGRNNKQYRKENKNKIKQNKKQYYEKNIDKILLKHKLYYEDNKDKFKQYREDNKDKIKKWKSEKFECVCGGRYTRDHKARHLKCKKHQNYINSLA